MKDNGSYVLGIISLIMVSVSCVLFVFYNVGGGRKSNSKNVRYAGYLGKLLFAASVILLSVSVLNGFAKGEGFRENLTVCNMSLGTGDVVCFDDAQAPAEGFRENLTLAQKEAIDAQNRLSGDPMGPEYPHAIRENLNNQVKFKKCIQNCKKLGTAEVPCMKICNHKYMGASASQSEPFRENLNNPTKCQQTCNKKYPFNADMGFTSINQKNMECKNTCP